MAGLLPPVIAELRANVTEFQAKMGEARKEMQKTTGTGNKAFNGLAAVGKAAALGIATSAVAVGAESIHMADKFEAAHARLENAVKNSGQKMETFKKTIDLQGKAFEKLGQNHTEYQGALARLTQATNDPKKAIQDMGIVADLAAARHIDLESAATLVGKALNGNTAVLKRMGIDLNVTAGGAKAVAKAHDSVTKATTDLGVVEAKIHSGRLTGAAATEALQKAQDKLTTAQNNLTTATNAGTTAGEQLHQRFLGAAAAQSETFGGKVNQLKAKLDDLMITIGQRLTPVIQKLAEIGLKAVTWLEKHKAVAEALAVVIGGTLVVAIGAFVIAALGAAAPIVGIGLAIAGVIAAGAYLADRFPKAFQFIRKVIGEAIEGIILGPFKFLLAAADTAFGWIPGIGDKIRDARKKFDEESGKMRAAIEGVPRDHYTTMHILGDNADFVNKWNTVANGLKAQGDVAQKLLGGLMPKAISGKARGGPVNAGEAYVVGENRPELFVPNQSGTIIPRVPTGGGGGVTVNVHASGVMSADKQKFAAEMVDVIQAALLKKQRSTSLGFKAA